MTPFEWPGLHVYEWADAVALIRAFEGPVRRADLAGMGDRRGALSMIVSQCNMPAYVRPNLDSIEEAWRDSSWIAGDRWLILIEGCAELRRVAPETFAALCDMAQNAVGEHAARGAAFHVVFVMAPSQGEDYGSY